MAIDSAKNPSAATYTLSITNVQLADAGGYFVIATDSDSPPGSATSLVAILKVDPTFTKITSGPVVTDRSEGAWEAASWWDYDNDGLLDLFIPQQWGYGTLVTNAVYRQNPVGTFTRVTNAITIPRRGVWMAAVADYDNDGDEDLLMDHFSGADDLFRNDGNGIFTALTASQAGAPVRDSDDSASVGWADYDRDGWIDIFAANSSYGSANPARNDCLYRNNGDGSFTKMTTNQVGMLVGDQAPSGPFSWADYDNDGWPDLWIGSVSSDNPAAVSGRQYVWHNNGDGTFSRASAGSLNSNIATGQGHWGDYDNDGYLDLFLTAWKGTNSLHRNVGGITFSDVSVAAGLAEATGAWPAGWGDYDNDGFLDLMVPRYGGTAALYRNNGNGTFTSVDVGSPLRDTNVVGVAWADYDNDGFLDLLMACEMQGGRNLLYRNNGNGNAWLKVKLVGTVSNRSAIGAKVRLQATIGGRTMWQLREITGNSGEDGGAGGLLAHFGLGDATKADVVRIEWPSGIVQELSNVGTNQFLTLTEPARLQMTKLGELSIQCWKGQAFDVQVSPDLSAWSTVATVTNTTGALVYTDPDAGTPARQFYRVVGK
ncbi:MAG: hypothetical protein GX456_19710 [Verrucomicrobia bacterium]|nr:hypothetical protein [Verrucomicrobiota bacterium]